MSHLTDTQLVILSNAQQAEDGSVLPLPDCLTINGGAIASVLSSLLRKGLVEERHLQGMGIADAGSHATGASSYSAICAQERVWRSDDDGRGVALVITPAGLDAIGIDAKKDEGPDTREVGTGSSCDTAPYVAGDEPPDDGHAASAAPGRASDKHIVRPGTGQALLVDLLQRNGGASLEELVQATGWQQHSVRGAISSTVRKKLGLTVVLETIEGRGRVYRIIP